MIGIWLAGNPQQKYGGFWLGKCGREQAMLIFSGHGQSGMDGLAP